MDGNFLREEGFSWHTFCHNLCDNLQTGGQEFVARAGDVVFWHSYLTHDGSIDVNDSPRIALLPVGLISIKDKYLNFEMKCQKICGNTGPYNLVPDRKRSV